MKSFRTLKKIRKILFPSLVTWCLILTALALSLSAEAQSGSVGTLLVRGQAGASQLFPQVKAARCQIEAETRMCDDVHYLNLNQAEALPSGRYLVGFENSVYPGWVVITPGAQVTLDLVKLSVPASIRKDATVRVFRDFDASIERNKLFFVQFFMSRPLFRLSQYSFGDLYLTSSDSLDVTLRLNYDPCNKIDLQDPDIEDALEICVAAMNVRTWRDMSVFFRFSGRDHMDREIQKGQFLQNLVSEAGDRRQIVMRRHLVSAPLRATDFVSVFPGQYRFVSDAPGSTSISVTAGPLFEKFD
ncbi:MAG: hypothetical protein ACK5Y2_03750 [Bdellovibrionales bacterium]